jgi:hypothetical protein
MRQDNFPPTSRYYPIEAAELTLDDGRIVRYLRRRFLPATERFSAIQEHRVAQAERLDQIAARYLGDPEQFWRIADANGAMHPRELVEEEGGRVKIALPEGIPGAGEE